MQRDEAITRIRAALKERSGKTWSVTGGRGTAWGWIAVTAPPRRRTANFDGTDAGEPGRCMTNKDRAELGRLMGGNGPCNQQDISVPASTEHRRFYVALAEGQEPGESPQAYWD